MPMSSRPAHWQQSPRRLSSATLPVSWPRRDWDEVRGNAARPVDGDSHEQLDFAAHLHSKLRSRFQRRRDPSQAVCRRSESVILALKPGHAI